MVTVRSLVRLGETNQYKVLKLIHPTRALVYQYVLYIYIKLCRVCAHLGLASPYALIFRSNTNLCATFIWPSQMLAAVADTKRSPVLANAWCRRKRKSDGVKKYSYSQPFKVFRVRLTKRKDAYKVNSAKAIVQASSSPGKNNALYFNHPVATFKQCN